MAQHLQIRRLPRAFAPELGAEAAARVSDLTPEQVELVTGAAGSSPYLKSLIEAQADWLTSALDDPEAALNRIHEQLTDPEVADLKSTLRLAKARLALLTALADLAGAWPLERVTEELSTFAAKACDLALKAEIVTLIRRDRLPGQGPADVENAGGLAVLAMGKMGADELNYSSDIDLICLFDESRYDPGDYQVARQSLVRATRNFCATLSDRTAEGYVFRTDLRLRPDPAVTPVCMAMEAAERYYESLGRTWERAAYIKARAAAGDTVAGARFLDTLKPFIWRRHLDFAAIQDAHDMRLRIRANKGLGGPVTVPGHDMKLGRGGIREIEFFTQTRQLIAGGRDPDLRVRGTVAGLAVLAAKDWIPKEVADALSGHYRAHREVEHRIQMLNDAQTHNIPSGAEDFERIACLMGMDGAALRADLAKRLNEVHTLTEGFFAPEAAPAIARTTPDELDTSICARWPTYPALRSERARQIFERLRPELMARLSRATKPAEALLALDGFLAGLPAGVQVFSLFEANPQLIDLLIDIVGTSPDLASYLSRHASAFDAVIGGDFFADWPGRAVLERELADRLAGEADYETQLDAARRWTREWHFRIGVHHLRNLVSARQAGAQYADLARAVITALLPVVVAQFAIKHGQPPGRGAVVLGLGSLGAGRLNAASDLDLIVVYDPEGIEASDGPRSLATRPYYARLTQALITALTAPMAEGRLYAVDMRLRPSGNQGPVATSLTAFKDYQSSEAWVWEHLALTRARVVAGGNEGLAEDVERFRARLLGKPGDRPAIQGEVRDMRARIAASKSQGSVWDVKIGPGRLQDVELIAQAGALIAGQPVHDVQTALSHGCDVGLFDRAAARQIARHYELFWSVLAATQLLSPNAPLDLQAIGEGGAAFLTRSAGSNSLAALESALHSAYTETGDLIERALKENEG